jgi:hypothetical protein
MKRTFKLVIINDNQPDRSVEEVELDNDSIPLENNIITIIAKKGFGGKTIFSKEDINFYFNGQQVCDENLRYRIHVSHCEYEDFSSELLTWEDLTEIAKVVTSSVTLLPKFSEYLKYLDIIINKIKDTNTLFFGTLFKTLDTHAAKFILKELGFPGESNSIFLPRNCNIKIIDNNVNCYYLDFENDGSGENTSASLFNEFTIFYERLFYLREPLGNIHPIISRWGGKVLIDANRPVNDPLKDVLLGKRYLVFNNCGFFDSISGKVFPKISDYPSNDLLTLKDIASNNMCVGFQTIPSVYFQDTVVDIDMSDVSSTEGNNKYVTACEFECNFLDDSLLPMSTGTDFTDALTNIRQKNSRCRVRLKDNSFTNLFPPFFKIKERLNSLGITNFYYSDKIFQGLWELLKNNPTDFSSESPDLIFSVCTGYIEYLHCCNRDKYNELISVFPREGAVRDLTYPYQLFSFSKRCYYSDKEENNVKRLFIYFYKNFKDRIPIEATEFYFGSDNVILENKNKTVLRTLNIDPEGKKYISIDINPLYNFFKYGLELGIEPNRLVSTVTGRNSDTDIVEYPEVGEYKKVPTAESMINDYVDRLTRYLPKSIEVEID